MCNSLADGVSILTALNHPAVKLMADLFHMAMEESDSPAALRAAAPHVAHVHLADNNRREPGKGHTDFRTCMAALRDSGFHGTAAVECILSGPARDVLPAAARTLISART
jgi:sugar phosphate isomerase/epimerase